MKQHTHTFWLTGGIFLLCLAEFSPTQAQNIPVADTTLPTNSVVNSSNKNNISITEGTVAGHNLFHSFQQFNIDEGQKVDFVSPSAAIENILIRVTGGSRSQIMGTLSTSGLSNPDLFLINPKGIVFGQNAQLDIRGSFVATTANAIDFGNKGFFSASAPNNPELLTVNPSAFLFNQIANQPINSIQVNRASLSVDNGQNLLLVGGNVTLDNATLNVQDGRIELGGVAASGTVGLNDEANTLRSNYPVEVQRADVSLTKSQVNVIGKGGGSIAINARNLDVLKGSSLEAGIGRDMKSDGTPAGDITLDAREEMKISSDSLIKNDVDYNAVGNSGSILIKAGSLSLTDEAQLSTIIKGEGETKGIFVQANKFVFIANSFLSTSPDEVKGVGNSSDINIKTGSLYLTHSTLNATTSREGRAGNVIIDAQNTVFVENSTVSSGTFGLGDGGTINIKAGELTLTKGGVISSTTTGKGNAGDINIYPVNAFSSVNISGVNADPKVGFSSGLLTSTEIEGAGHGGNINVTTGELRVSDGGVLTARTRSASPGGNITVNANTLEATSGGQVITSTFGTGRAGDITVTATDSVKISGSDPTYFNREQQSGPTTLDNDGSASGLLARVLGQETAANAGNILVQARSINLDNQGVISATTTLGEGGNIELRPQEFLLMGGGSQISTTAGTQGAGGNGGNITINAPDGFIVAKPNQNSDITANAYNGNGGTVKINATKIFGIAPLTRQDLERLRPTDLDPRQLQTNDITAISQTSPNLSGIVEINTLDVDPYRGLINLPAVPVDTQVSQVCQVRPGENQSSFTITGRGGLPPNPTKDILTLDVVQVDWVTLNPKRENHSSTSVSTQANSSSPAPIVEAQGWVRNAKGEIVLTADASTALPHSSWFIPASCL